MRTIVNQLWRWIYVQRKQLDKDKHESIFSEIYFWLKLRVHISFILVHISLFVFFFSICVIIYQKNSSYFEMKPCFQSFHRLKASGPVLLSSLGVYNAGVWISLIKSKYEDIQSLIKSPRYTGGDFMFLYRFVRRRPQILVHAITFEQLFGFLSFLARLLALTYRLTDYILGDFRCDLDLEFSRSNIELAISQPKMVGLPRNEKQTHRLNSRLQMGPWGLTLAMTLTLNFQGQISNWLYLSQKWSDWHETKSKYIDWSQDLKCDHQVCPWSWPWPWIFKVKYGIGYISAKYGPIATKRKANTSIEL